MLDHVAVDRLQVARLACAECAASPRSARAARRFLRAVVGVYGVVAYRVAQRARELGPVLLLTLAVTRVLGAVLYGLGATDAGVLGLAAAALASASLAGRAGMPNGILPPRPPGPLLHA